MAFGHGKVILLGEHSVVYERPALALSVDRGAEVSFKLANSADRTTLHIAPWNVEVDSGPEVNEGREPLQEALRIARGFYKDDVEVTLSATMRLPAGAGMGSSAALGVAVLRALDEARGISRSDEEICERSLAWERVFHTFPSGIDSALATHGGMKLFQLKQPLKNVVPRKPIRLVVGFSGSARRAGAMVESVRHQFERDPKRIGQLFDAIASIVHNGKLAIEQGDLKGLGQLMTMNHKLLSALMLSTDTLEEMNERAIAAGALGAKVTGAGGGGCMIALVDGDEQARSVAAALEAMGKPVY